MHIDAGRIAFRPVVAASVAVIANQLFLLGVDRDDGLPGQGNRLNVKERSISPLWDANMIQLKARLNYFDQNRARRTTLKRFGLPAIHP